MWVFSQRSEWITLSIFSGICAALNGVFAKLTTTNLTTQLVENLTGLLDIENLQSGVEVVVRVIFFAINLIFNGIMWTLFTKALARGTSTTQVSILNTTSNFIFTAILGFLIFSETLPQLWFIGASLMVIGNVIIGRREENQEDQMQDNDVSERENLITDESNVKEEDKSWDRDVQASPIPLEEYIDTS